MVKRATKKQRGQHTRSVKKMIVTGLEGKNVTYMLVLVHMVALSLQKIDITLKKV